MWIVQKWRDLYRGRDVDFRHLVNCLPEGASFTMLSDSCHSGGLIDKEREQIGGPSKPTDQTTSRSHNPKTIPFESILEQLSSQTGLNTPDIGTHLLEIFGTDASLLFCSTRLELDSIRHLKPDEGILLSGCQASETSADVPHNNGVKAHGAFSYAVQVVLNENLGPLSNKEVVIRVRDLLQALNFEQHPCLYCSDENADAVFLGKPESASI